MNIDLSGKTASVTGGNVGIGAGISLALAECGAAVALTYYSHKESAEETVAAIEADGGKAVAFALNATDSANVTEVVNQAAAALGGKIDILVNNAGHLIDRVEVHEMSDEYWHSVIDVNLSSVFYATRAALPYMGDGGRIVNMASLAARNGGGFGTVPYAAPRRESLALPGPWPRS